MTSRDKILAAVLANQPTHFSLPEINFRCGEEKTMIDDFRTVLKSVGGRVINVASFDEILHFIKGVYAPTDRIISTIPELYSGKVLSELDTPHDLHDTELALIRGHFGVAENGAVWVTESLVTDRVLPFICQHLAVVIEIKNIVSTMHEAYQCIGQDAYGFGTFIAGPSKTADIEQSLVLGAHGPKSMVVFLLNQMT